jgi:Ras family protein A
MLIVFSKGAFPEGYVPNMFEAYMADIDIDGVHVKCVLWDTAGQEEYDRLRPLTYPDSHIVLICFSIAAPETLDNVEEKVGFLHLSSTRPLISFAFLQFCIVQWIGEVMHFCRKIPTILVGCKKDLRNDPKVIEKLERENMQPVTSAAVSMHFYLILV